MAEHVEQLRLDGARGSKVTGSIKIKYDPDLLLPDVVADMTRRCLLVQNEARRLCPVDTGRLRSSIRYDVSGGHPSEVVGTVSTDVEYALWVHEGTQWIRPRPFLSDALPAGGG